MPMTSVEMIKYLRKNGFETVSQNGSHVKMKNVEIGKTVIVPCHSKDLKKRNRTGDFKTSRIKMIL